MAETPGEQKKRQPQFVRPVAIEWFVRRDDAPAEFGRVVVDLVSELIPDALPTKFGVAEPPRNKLDVADPASFRDLVDEEATVIWDCAFPGLDGCISGITHPVAPFDPPVAVGHVRLSVDRSALLAGDAVDTIRRLIPRIAGALNAFFAVAAVEGPFEKTGRSIWVSGRTALPPLVVRDEWLGLPRWPIWLAWFGRPYVAVVKDELPAEAVTGDGSTGLLFSTGDEVPLPFAEVRRQLGGGTPTGLLDVLPHDLLVPTEEFGRAARLPEGL